MTDPTAHHDEPDELDLDEATVADLEPDDDVHGGAAAPPSAGLRCTASCDATCYCRI